MTVDEGVRRMRRMRFSRSGSTNGVRRTNENENGTYWCWECMSFTECRTGTEGGAARCEECGGSFVERSRVRTATTSQEGESSTSTRSQRNIWHMPTAQMPARASVSVQLFTAEVGADGVPVPVPGTQSAVFNAGSEMGITSLEDFVRQLSFLESNSRITNRAASKVVVESLPKKTITESCQKGECCVCMSDFETGDEVISMPCGHSFHDACIKQWLNTNRTCPVCRDKLPTDADVERNVDPNEGSR